MSNTKKILIVDDEENIRRILKKALEKKGYTVKRVINYTSEPVDHIESNTRGDSYS